MVILELVVSSALAIKLFMLVTLIVMVVAMANYNTEEESLTTLFGILIDNAGYLSWNTDLDI